MSVWRNTLDHFDAIKVGLTATPAAHTTAYFGDVVFRYDVRAGRPRGLPGRLRRGRHQVRRAHERRVPQGRRAASSGWTPTPAQRALDQLEDERAFDAADIERDDHRARLQPQDHRGSRQSTPTNTRRATGRFPKILIFAANDLPHTSHADQLVKICRDVFGRGDDFVKKITGNANVDRPLQRIREFRNRPNPKIVVTVDMLSTGVDIPALEFIVFLRPVKSRILWEQMLGRGTRMGDDINKSQFVVFDCFDGTLIEYFRNVSSFDIEPPRRTPLTHPGSHREHLAERGPRLQRAHPGQAPPAD